jgi:dCTP deaminase
MLHRARPGLSPGARLRAEIDRLGLDQGAVADATCVSRQTINNIVNGRQAISRAMAGKLGRLTGRSSDYWLQSQFFDAQQQSADERGSRSELAPSHAGDGFRPSAILVNHQIIRAVESGIIGVDPFRPANVQLVSLDLTLDDFIITTDGEEIDISDEQAFSLEAGRTVNVRTCEYIELPPDYVGRVGAMTRLARFGIIMSHGFQVDPGFKGHLQFCLFNAGGRRFELRSGVPIISLELIPLNAVPSTDRRATVQVQAASDRAAVLSHFRSDDCDRLVRNALRGHVKIEAVSGEFVASVQELDIQIVQTTEESAISSAIRSALRTLAALRAHPRAKTELGEKYDAFFERLAARLQLGEDQYRRALIALGIWETERHSALVKLRDGSKAMLQPPTGSARITLKHLAQQLREDPRDLVLAFSGITADFAGERQPSL